MAKAFILSWALSSAPPILRGLSRKLLTLLSPFFRSTDLFPSSPPFSFNRLSCFFATSACDPYRFFFTPAKSPHFTPPSPSFFSLPFRCLVGYFPVNGTALRHVLPTLCVPPPPNDQSRASFFCAKLLSPLIVLAGLLLTTPLPFSILWGHFSLFAWHHGLFLSGFAPSSPPFSDLFSPESPLPFSLACPAFSCAVPGLLSPRVALLRDHKAHAT